MEIKNRDIEICTAASGKVTAKVRREDGRELYLHSKFDPIEEAKLLLKDVPINDKTLYVVIGFGFGYHVKELLKQIPQSSRIVVIESFNWRLSAIAKEYYQSRNEKWLSDYRLTITTFSSPESVCFALANIFERNELSSLEMFTHIPTVATDEQFYRKVIETIPEEFSMRLADQINTLDTTLENNLTNYISNLAFTWRTPSLEGFKNKWAEKPLIIVAAGPSLTDQLSSLKEAQGKALIVCVGTAAKPLMDNGIIPDFVISVDPYCANMAHFLEWDTSKVPLIYYQGVWRGIPANYQGPKFWFTMKNESPIPLRSEFIKSIFFEGGTVAFSALQFANFVKASPIIFVGQDMSFNRGRTHAEGIAYNSSYNEEDLPEGFFLVPGTDGDLVVTNQTYYSYLVFMQEYILKNRDSRYINTSLTGAKIEGMEVMPLNKAIKDFCAHTCNIDKVVDKIYSNSKTLVTKSALVLLNKWEKELTRYLQDNHKESELDKLISSFMKLDIYKINHVNYRRFFYAVSLREKWFNISANYKVAERLRSHAAAILDVVTRIKGELI